MPRRLPQVDRIVRSASLAAYRRRPGAEDSMGRIVMARAMVRFSLDNDYGSAARNQIVPILRAVGFRPSGTGSWDAVDQPLDDLVDALHEALDIMRDPPAPAALDHLWVYVDEPSY